MRLPAALLLAAASIAASAGGARADEPPLRPPPMPARDVAIDAVLLMTNMTGPHPPANVHITFHAGTHRMRVAAEGKPGYMILDPTGGRTLLVSTDKRAWLEQPFVPQTHAMFILAANFSFAPVGNSTVAGLSCTTWDMQSTTVGGSVCVTQDGVIMRVEAADTDGDGDDFQLKLITRHVDYAQQPPSDFEPPDGFQKIERAKPAKAP